MLVFPFKDGTGLDPQGYTVEAFMRLVFVDEGNNEANRTVQLLRDRDGSTFAHNFRPVESDWKNTEDQFKLTPGAEGYDRPEVPQCLLLSLFGSSSWTPPQVKTARNIYGSSVNLGTGDQKTGMLLSRIDIYGAQSSRPSGTKATP